MQITVDHNYCQVDKFYPKLNSFLSYRKKEYLGYGQNKKFVFTQVSLVENNKFLTGLLPRVISKFNPEIIYIRTIPQHPYQVPELSIELYPYQVEYLIEALKSGRCIIKAPTGSGKTILLAALIAAINQKTIVLAPGIDVMNQLIAKLKELLPSSFTITDTPKNKEDIIVTLPGRIKNIPLEFLENTEVLIMDEAHGAAAHGVTNVILSINAPFRYGFTATPTGRSDNRDLIVEGLFGEIIEIVDHEDLVETGFLPGTTVDIYSNGFDGDYLYMEDLLIVNNVRRNTIISDIVNNHKYITKKDVVLVLVRRVEHGKLLANLIKDSVYVDGSSSSEFRMDVQNKALNGQIRVIIATQIFAQGIDIPNITLCINAGGGKSSILTGQKFGRVTRLYGGQVKKFVDIYDFLNPTTEKHSQERLRLYRDRTNNIKLLNFSNLKREEVREDSGV